MADINQSDLYLYGACICCFTAIYTDFPALVGCSAKEECLCIKWESCCKMNTPPYPISFESNKNGNICDIALYCFLIALKSPTVLCKGKGQCFCFANQVALPPDDDVPMMCAICFVALYPKFGILKKVSEVK
jgi:hypothetical protein